MDKRANWHSKKMTSHAAILKQLVDSHWTAFVLYARTFCDEPEDAVQEALMRLMKEDPLPETVVAWIYRVVRNCAISRSRSKQRRKKREKFVSRNVNWFENVDNQLDGRFATEILQQMEKDVQEVVVLRVWGGVKFEEIASICKTSVSTAHRRYEQGIDWLRERLEGHVGKET